MANTKIKVTRQIDNDELTIKEELLLQSLSCLRGKTPFLQPVRIKLTTVLIRPSYGHLQWVS